MAYIFCLSIVFTSSFFFFPKKTTQCHQGFYCLYFRTELAVHSIRQMQRHLVETIWLLFYRVHQLLPWKAFLDFIVSHDFALFSHLIDPITY